MHRVYRILEILREDACESILPFVPLWFDAWLNLEEQARQLSEEEIDELEDLFFLGDRVDLENRSAVGSG